MRSTPEIVFRFDHRVSVFAPAVKMCPLMTTMYER